MSPLMKVGFILCFCAPACLAYCEEYDIESCQTTSGLKDYLSAQGIDITSQHAYESNWLFTLNKTQLARYCSLFDSYKECLDTDVIGGCSIEVKLVINGVNKGVKFVCKETFNEYLSEHHTCLKKSSVRSAITGCFKSATDKIKSDKTKDSVCRDAKEGESCQINGVKDKCGEKTAEWLKKFITKVDNPTLSHFGCNDLPRWAIYLIIFAAVFVLSLVLTGIKWYIVKRRASHSAPTGRPTLTFLSAYKRMEEPPQYTAAEHQVAVPDTQKLQTV